MKTYTKPSVHSFEFFAQDMLATSPGVGGGVTSGSTAGQSYNPNDVDYSRQQSHGVGGGLWEDMK